MVPLDFPKTTAPRFFFVVFSRHYGLNLVTPAKTMHILFVRHQIRQTCQGLVGDCLCGRDAINTPQMMGNSVEEGNRANIGSDCLGVLYRL